jgi:hypothetical protein
MRKTINVLEMLNWANTQLKRTDEWARAEFKSGICTMIETILMDSGNYKGFMFIDNSDSEIATLGYYSRKYFINSKLSR